MTRYEHLVRIRERHGKKKQKWTNSQQYFQKLQAEISNCENLSADPLIQLYQKEVNDHIKKHLPIVKEAQRLWALSQMRPPTPPVPYTKTRHVKPEYWRLFENHKFKTQMDTLNK